LSTSSKNCKFSPWKQTCLHNSTSIFLLVGIPINKFELISIVFLSEVSSITKRREYKFQVIKLGIGNQTSPRNYKLEPLEDAMNISV
jgi:hypothetical protein